MLPAAELPAGLRQLTDPATPLPSGWLLIGEGLSPLLPPLLKTLAAWAAGLVFALGISGAATALAWIYASIALACFGYSVLPGRKAWAAIEQRRAFRAGRWRRGLHLGPDALLLWDGSRGVAFNRSEIDSVQRVEVEIAVRPAKGPPRKRIEHRCELAIRRDGAPPSGLPLPMIDPGSADPDHAGGAVVAIERWVAGGAPRTGAAGHGALRAWVRNLAWGHGLLLAASVLGLLGTTLAAAVFGISSGALLGLLVGFPAFLLFPLILHRSIGARLARDARGRPVGWGYIICLGLAAMLLIIGGSNVAGHLQWQLRASEAPPLDAGAIAAERGAMRLYPWTAELTPTAAPIGHYAHRRYLGDGRWIESSYYVAPLDGQRGCLWLGLRTGEGAASARSRSRLLNDRSDWLLPVAGLEASGFTQAVEAARRQAGGALPGCESARVMQASPSLNQLRLDTLGQLALLIALSHLLPALALLVWAAWRADRRPPLRRAT
ncbi:hypothetical protein [Pseudomarimonas salicorniae]|nr:hypothetical protein [Lysobacter sp. CAU 1642]